MRTVTEHQEPAPKANAWYAHRFLILILRLLLAVVFLLSSFGKLVDVERYSVDAVYNFGVLPMILARPFGLVMPLIELLCGLGLLLGVLTRLAALGVGLMSIAFFIAKAVVVAQGRHIDCGCFGAIVETLASVTIFMDLPMVVMAFLILIAPNRSRHFVAVGRFLPERTPQWLRLMW
ncbi:MAG TPA: MauE/DoxX family redox-associated membrane protein [Syntrophorhabdales bacterium]|nr:MauE/DoxX family redox-associated membrane protein [Syntrophorhabdales bacterium]